MAEGIERIVVLVVAGTVAGEDDAIVAEAYMATQDLGIRVLGLIEEELVGMKKMDAGIRLAARLGRTARRGRRATPLPLPCWEGS
jgi:hypothetical protein